MNFLKITRDYHDPIMSPVEVVERKGVGHPDSLADALANEVSTEFSLYCLNHFGFILHHNVDKLYIGAGYFHNDYKYLERVKPVKVQVNGRISNVLGDESIDIESIQQRAVSRYLSKVLPHLDVEGGDLEILSNATQHTRSARWFTPACRNDVPDATDPKANDTSFCIAHWPPTPAESVTYQLERYFWEDKDGFAVPRFPEIGQDIKVLALRQESRLEITLCVPTISTRTDSYQHYQDIIKYHELKLQALAEGVVLSHQLTASVRINPHQRQSPYMLGIGSCIESGEEGLVGRGNSISGIISSHRAHTQESWAGKNPVYHTGRVLSYLTAKLARAISTSLNVKCSVSAMTRCGDSLMPPSFLGVSVNTAAVHEDVCKIVESEFLCADYVKEILGFRPWMMKL